MSESTPLRPTRFNIVETDERVEISWRSWWGNRTTVATDGRTLEVRHRLGWGCRLQREKLSDLLMSAVGKPRLTAVLADGRERDLVRGSADELQFLRDKLGERLRL